jgi:hypothetical protein
MDEGIIFLSDKQHRESEADEDEVDVKNGLEFLAQQEKVGLPTATALFASANRALRRLRAEMIAMSQRLNKEKEEEKFELLKFLKDNRGLLFKPGPVGDSVIHNVMLLGLGNFLGEEVRPPASNLSGVGAVLLGSRPAETSLPEFLGL